MESAQPTEVPRGRSPTKKKHSTNAARTMLEKNDDDDDDVNADADDSFDDDVVDDEQSIDGTDLRSSSSSSSSLGIFLQNLALFGDSTMALMASFFLLVVAIAISFTLDDETMTPNNVGSGLSAFLSLSSSSWWLFGSNGSDSNMKNNFVTDRCESNPNSVPALQPGQLITLFTRIVSTTSGVVVHSNPSLQNTRFKSPPWIITIDDFLSDEECDAMIRHGYEIGYKQSIDVEKLDDTNDHSSIYGMATINKRTSETAWCTTRNGCRNKTIPHQIHRRISNVLQIPTENSEDFQLLKYEVGQYYKAHHDYIPHQKTRQCGPRILTFFMYLSSNGNGGETHFPQLNVTIQPQKGRALLFPNVFDHDPVTFDGRLRHEALPVIEGTKYAANAWYHLFDYQQALRNGCN